MFIKLYTVLLSFGLLIPALHAEEITLRLGSSYYPPITTAAKDGLMDLTYQELARRLGIKITINALDAAERVLINANEGIDDGDVGRVGGLESKYTNLLFVPESVAHYQIAVFSKTADFKVAGTESIKPYEIAIVKGKKHIENLTQGAPFVTKVETGEQAFGMLDKGRVDIVLFEKFQGMGVVKNMGLKGIKLLQPQLDEEYFYLYLHKRHKDLIPKFSAEIRKMKQDGTFNRIYEKVLREYSLQ